MPLIHSDSKEARSENIRSEMHAGKPQKQAIAIAYSVGRKSKKRKKKHNSDTLYHAKSID